MFDSINIASTFLTIVFILGLGWQALKNNRSGFTNRLFFLFSVALSLWESFNFLEEWTYCGEKLMLIMIHLDFFLGPIVVFIASLFVASFALSKKWIKTAAVALSLPTLALSFLSLSDAVFSDALFIGGSMTFKFGKIFWIYGGALLAYTLASMASIILRYPKLSGLARKKINFIIVGFSLSSIAIVTVNLFLQNAISNQWFRIINLSLLLILVFSMFQAIVLYNLMRIKLIIKRPLIYFFLSISILIPAGIGLYVFERSFPNRTIWASLVILAISLSIISKLKKKYYRLANKYFFSSLYDAHEVIYSLNKALHSSLNATQICRSVSDILTKAFHPEAIATLSYDFEREKWIVIHNNHFNLQKDDSASLKTPPNYKTLAKLFHKNRPLTIEVIEQKLAATADPLLKYLQKIKAEIITPIKAKSRLAGLLLFGAKEAGDDYTVEDLRILTTISTEIGLAMENVRLYEKEKKFNSNLRAEINKATRQLQEQNRELQRLDAAKDEFVSIVSHQLRTPLTGIRWFTGLLLNNKKKNLNVEQLDFLEQIGTSNKKMIRLVNDLLDVSHIETGYKFKIKHKKFLLSPLIREVLDENVLMIKSKELKITDLIPKSLKINADRAKIKQVWQNLLSNAAAYTAEGKKITAAVQTDKENLVFSVKDEGIGIPKNQQSRIFEKFFRTKNANLQDPNGTGLGLYIAKGIIQKHGGEIWFKSTENKGTTFFFSLPKNIKSS